MKKIYFLMWSIFAMLWWMTYLFASWYTFSSVSANPDYICVKDIYDSPCEITYCWAWWTNGMRTCYWQQTTQVSYYLIRTSCEAWYSQITLGWNVWWNSWRQSADYISQSSSCTIQQFDNVSPHGDAVGK